MKRFFCGVLLFHAAQAFAAEPAMPSGAYASAQFGNGRIYGGNAGSDRGMAGRALELRFGHALLPGLLGGTPDGNANNRLRVDFVHYNEGHPDNNHRDGFASR